MSGGSERGPAAGSGAERPDTPRHSSLVALRDRWPLAALLLLLLVSEAVGSPPPGLAETVLLLGMTVQAGAALAAPLVPMGAAVASAGVLASSSVAAQLLGYPPAGLHAAGLAASVATAAELVRQGRPLLQIVGVGALMGANLLSALLLAVRFPALPATLLTASMLGCAVSAGLYLRVRDREQRRAITVEVAAARQEERLALAREMHDVVAYHVTAMVITANAARWTTTPGPTNTAFGAIADTGADALDAMRRVLGTLRRPDARVDLATDLRTIVDRCPVSVTLEVAIDEPLPPDLERTVLRLVTESLTNVARHARGATNVQVRVTPQAGSLLHLEVTNDAARTCPAAGGRRTGHGLVGMAERVELLGGTFHAGPTDHGWTVNATLPGTPR